MTKISEPTVTVAKPTGVLNPPYFVYRPPVYICPKHGEVDSYITVFAEWKEKGKYCQHCWAEWLAANFPKLTEKPRDP